MAKTKNLRGVPGNLAFSYLSTLGYYENGYMADWLIRTFDKLNITQIKIDILNETIFPKEAQIKPLLSDTVTFIFFMVREKGLEPSHLSIPVPKTGVSTVPPLPLYY